MITNLLLGQVVGEVGDHDLGLGRNAIGGGTTLTTLTGSASLVLARLVLVSVGFVGDVLQGLNLSIGGNLSGVARGSTVLLLLVLSKSVSLR